MKEVTHNHNAQDILIPLLEHALSDVDMGDSSITLEHPADLTHGDYSCNIAMQLAKSLNQKPRDLAEDIVARIPESEYVRTVEVAGPGFINFYLSDAFFEQSIRQVLEDGSTFGSVSLLKGKRVLIEESAPNLFKPFHVGHVLNTSIGESLDRITRFAGAEVIGVVYPSDISLGVAKALWSLKQKGLTEFDINIMGQCYADGNTAYEESEEAKAEIIEINTELNKEGHGTVAEIYAKGRELNLKHFVEITQRLGSEFDDYFFESESGKIGKEIVASDTTGIFTQSDGAIVFKGEEYGLHTRVFITSKGLAVYEAKDIGLIKQKFEKYNPDVSIVITDIEQKQYFQVIKKVAELLFGKMGKEWGERSLYLQHGRLRFEGGKISSRYGNVPLAVDLIEQVKGLTQGTDDMLKEQVAIAAIKYSFLRVSTGKNIIFDFDKSISVEGDSGPYLQYTYARCQSVLGKAHPSRGKSKAQIPKDWEVTNIEKLLYRFPEVVERAALEYEPHYIANYLNEVASAYNSWYGQGKILDGTDAEQYKLALTGAAAHTIKNGLYLLGIEAPEKM